MGDAKGRWRRRSADNKEKRVYKPNMKLMGKHGELNTILDEIETLDRKRNCWRHGTKQALLGIWETMDGKDLFSEQLKDDEEFSLAIEYMVEDSYYFRGSQSDEEFYLRLTDLTHERVGQTAMLFAKKYMKMYYFRKSDQPNESSEWVRKVNNKNPRLGVLLAKVARGPNICG